MYLFGFTSTSAQQNGAVEPEDNQHASHYLNMRDQLAKYLADNAKYPIEHIPRQQIAHITQFLKVDPEHSSKTNAKVLSIKKQLLLSGITPADEAEVELPRISGHMIVTHCSFPDIAFHTQPG